MDKVQLYINDNKERFINELFDILRIPSISAQSEHKEDMVRCAEHLAVALMKAGADHAEVLPTAGNPVVFGERKISDTAKTVLIYGHYDVCPSIPVRNGRPSLSSRKSKMGAFGVAEQTTTRDNSSCTSRLSKRCVPPTRCHAT